jgi:hypothetical protein
MVGHLAQYADLGLKVKGKGEQKNGWLSKHLHTSPGSRSR